MNEEVYATTRRPLSTQDRFLKRNEPIDDIKRALVPVMLAIVGFPALIDSKGE